MDRTITMNFFNGQTFFLFSHTQLHTSQTTLYSFRKVPNKFPTNYADYPGTVEYFDVYSPVITSTYAEIVWKTLETVPLPPAIVKRFAGKPMAVIGLEWDQVSMTSPPR